MVSAMRRALIILAAVPAIAGCGTSAKDCARASSQAQRAAQQEYVRQLRVPGQTQVNAERTAIVAGQSSLYQWNYDHKGTCSWDRNYRPKHS